MNNKEEIIKKIRGQVKAAISHYSNTNVIEELKGGLKGIESFYLTEEEVPELKELREVILNRLEELRPKQEQNDLDGIKKEKTDENVKRLELRASNNNMRGFVNIVFIIISILIVIAVAVYYVIVK